ncbi:DUF6157 family protein [Chryseobacterium viscerum]|uniref:DUF6157 family protein n=1 Tax=Chryseobacterium viscerum TaxID=1037377 RepID=UPI003742319E
MIFEYYVIKYDISDNEKHKESEKFFSNGQTYLLCSLLALKYKSRIYYNRKGKNSSVYHRQQGISNMAQ